ncbi:MAG: MBL fold metallo-hydrolase [Deltaproteobacteria bacterium]|nr:MBL fold metallo-hydrolase [Deltaproteobacteria bacterium]
MIRIRVLGSGDTAGVPVLGCRCLVCSAGQIIRARPSLAIFCNSGWCLIDCGPDFKQQTFKFDFANFLGVCLTHAHLDHVLGIPELREIARTFRKKVSLYMSEDTYNMLATRFKDRIKVEDSIENSSLELLSVKLFKNYESFLVGDLQFQPIELMHGNLKTSGFRLGNFAYCSDCNFISDQSIEFLTGINTLILDAGQNQFSKDHFSVSEAILVGQRLKVDRLFLTHLGHEFEYSSISDRLPEWVSVLEDGMEFTISL